MKVAKIIILLSLLTSCNSPKEKTEKSSVQQSDIKAPAAINCYRYASAADTITLKVVRAGKSITGTLVYNLKEKDKNSGTVQGTMKDDILIADYTFMSEGVQSTRQIAFKLEGNTFVEGFGDLISKNEKMYFKTLDSLKYDSSIKLAEIKCQ